MKLTTYTNRTIKFLLLRKSSLLAFILFFVLLSCSNNADEPNAAFTPQNIPFTLIGKNYMGSTTNIPQQNTIITNQTQWTNLLNQMNPQLNGGAFVTTTVDFTTDILIAVIDMERPNTSYAITINSITENQNNITVTISTSGSMVGYNAGTQPYHIVKIPKQTKPFVFQ